MDVKIIILTVCLTTLTPGALHGMNLPSETNRNLRDIRVAYEPTKESMSEFQPPVFNYQSARQMAVQYQDQQKQRYAQQQQMDVKNSLTMRIYNSPASYQIGQVRSWPRNQANVNEDWQPFQPTPVPKILASQRKSKNTRLRTNRMTKPKHNKSKSDESRNLSIAGSENSEIKEHVDRHDIPESQRIAGDLIYLPSNLIQHVLENSENVQTLGDINGHQVSKVDYSALSNLVGKNPNVQLEGLHRLLEGTPENVPIFPVIHRSQPFKAIDHTPIKEKSADIPNPNTRPNIQVDHEHTPLVSSIIPTNPVDQNALINIQKQLDEASKLEADQALSRAQEQARAHVEAQHKAIEEAQKDILDKLHETLDHPHASPLIQINPQVQEQLFNLGPAPTAKDPSAVSKSNKHSFRPEITTVHATSLPLKISTNDKTVQINQYPSKDVQYYAPNHIHQALQAEVESHNKDVLIRPKSSFAQVGQNHQETIGNKNTQQMSGKEQQSAQTYQPFHLEMDPGKREGVHSSPSKLLDGFNKVSGRNFNRVRRNVNQNIHDSEDFDENYDYDDSENETQDENTESYLMKNEDISFSDMRNDTQKDEYFHGNFETNNSYNNNDENNFSINSVMKKNHDSIDRKFKIFSKGREEIHTTNNRHRDSHSDHVFRDKVTPPGYSNPYITIINHVGNTRERKYNKRKVQRHKYSYSHRGLHNIRRIERNINIALRKIHHHSFR